MNTQQFAEKTFSEIQNLLSQIGCLIVTTTSVETASFQAQLKPFNDDKIIRYHHKSYTFYIGKFGNYLVGHVANTSTGSINPGASHSTVKAGIEFFNPKAIIMLGIAYGVNNKNQKIGDVIVSESVIPHDIVRVSPNEHEYRCNIPPAGVILLNRFKNGYNDWFFPIQKKNNAKVIFGKMLSSEKLIDNKKFRDILSKKFPGVVGGEMEGVGLATAAHEAKLEWIIVKAICDFADGHKSQNKTVNQKLAAAASVDLCEHVMSSRTVFDGLGISAMVDKQLERNVFNDQWPVSKRKHFELLDTTIATHVGDGKIIVTADVKNIADDIATCYIVVKFACSGNYDQLVFNSDTHYSDNLETMKIYDIYPYESKTLKLILQLPHEEINAGLEYKIEIWSPKRMDFNFISDSRIALFYRCNWKPVNNPC